MPLLAADAVVRRGLADLAGRPGVVRAALALVEGGGRRLRFTASDRQGVLLDWCHIDAYDDVPLTAVVRTGSRVAGTWDELAPCFPDFVARQHGGTARALAAEPLVVHGHVLGGVVLYLDAASAAGPFEVDALAHELRAAQARLARVDGALAERPVAPDARVADCDVDGLPQAVGGARRFVRRQLDVWGVEDDVLDTAVLCVSELVTNAVMHTGAASELRVQLEDDVLTVTVRDRGSHGVLGRGPDPGLDDPLRVHGRGLQMVAALTSRWGSELDAAGTTVWFVLDRATGPT